MQPLAEWLDANMPADDETRIAHGDYRMGNVMFHPTEPHIVAVFDWEISTLGHPLGDLAYCAILYGSTPEQFYGVEGLDLEALGIPTFEAFDEIYRQAAGRAEGLTNAHMAHRLLPLRRDPGRRARPGPRRQRRLVGRGRRRADRAGDRRARLALRPGRGRLTEGGAGPTARAAGR